MPATLKLPYVGEVQRRYVIIGGVAVAGAVAYVVLWKRKQGAPTTAVDAATGAVAADGTGYTNPVPGAVGGGQPDTTASGLGPLTDADWTQAVLADFRDAGDIYDPLFAANTLGKYLAGVPLTQEEATLVRAAIGLEGKPPQSGNLPIVLVSTSSQPGGTPAPHPVPAPGPRPGPTPAPRGPVYVQTAKFTNVNPPWNSTLSGIASHEHTTVDALMLLNRGNPDVVDRNTIRYPGRVRVS